MRWFSQRIVSAACLSFTEACAIYKNSSHDLLCASPSLLLTEALFMCCNGSARSDMLNAESFQTTRSPVAFANLVSLVSTCNASQLTQPEFLSPEADALASSNGNEPLWLLLLVSVYLLCFLCCGPYHKMRRHAKRFRRKKKSHRHSRDSKRARHKVISMARLVGHERKPMHRRRKRLAKQLRLFHILRRKQQAGHRLTIPVWARPQAQGASPKIFAIPVPPSPKTKAKAVEKSRAPVNPDIGAAKAAVQSSTSPWPIMFLGGAGGSQVTRRKREDDGKDPDNPSLYEKIDALVLMVKAGIVPEEAFESSLSKILGDDQRTGPKQPRRQQSSNQSLSHNRNAPSAQDHQWEKEKVQPPKAAKPPTDPKPDRWVTATTGSISHRSTRTHKAFLQSFVSSEWTVPPIVTSYDECHQAMLNGTAMPGNIIEVDWQQYEELKDMLSAYEFKAPITMMWQGNYATSEKQKVAWVRAQSSAKNPFAPVQVTCESFNEGPKPRPPTKAAIATSDASTKVTLRITAPECYRAIHASDNKGDNPGKIIAHIQQWQLGLTSSQLTGGSWVRQWTKKGAQLVGHLKIKEEHASVLLTHSGRNAVFFTKTGDRANQKKVSWIQRNKQESDETYFRRVQQQAAKKAIRFRSGGANDLGVDQDKADEEPIKYHWKVQGTPSSWDEADLSVFLEAQRWTDVRISYRRKAGKHKATWFLQPRMMT